MKTKRKQKWLCGIGTLTVCFMLTGCHMSHEWQEATCTTPKTCSVGGETEGAALGHTWVDATCAEPKHCSVCGETEGEALAHTWIDATCAEAKHCSVCGETEGEALEHSLTEANYQQAATCEVCGETDGEPLQADFEKYGWNYITELDKEYPFVNKCAYSDDMTTGKVSFSDYKVFSSDDTHEEKEGYEWKEVTLTIIFDDKNAMEYGYSGFATISGDYYDMNTCLNGEDAANGDYIFTLNFNGTDYTECIERNERLKAEWVTIDDNNYYFIVQERKSYCIPVGYNGIVISVYNSEAKEQVGNSIESIEDALPYLTNENTITFKLQ